MSLENQVFISYFSRTHLIKGEALNGGVEWRVGCGGRGGGVGAVGRFGLHVGELSSSTN